MGRPPKKPSEKQGEIISVRMRKAERKQLERDARHAGLSLSAFLMQCWRDRG